MDAIGRELRREPAPGIEGRAALSTKEACTYLNIGLTTLYRELQSGRLPHRKIGRKTVIKKIDADKWLDELPSGLNDYGRRPQAEPNPPTGTRC